MKRPDLWPLEIWDLTMGEDGRILWDFMEQPDFAAALIASLETLRAGAARSRTDGPLPGIVRDFDAVFVSGGRSFDERVRAELDRVSFEVIYAAENVFVGETGGLRLLQENGLSGWVVDLGQRQLKISNGVRRWIFPRDFAQLPLREDRPEENIEEQRKRLREFVVTHLRSCIDGTPPAHSGLVLALPCRIHDDCRIEGSSYIGMASDHALPIEIAIAAGFSNHPVFLVNDAELAAWSARYDSRVSSEKKTLVLTLGFGVGAALLLPCR